MKKLVIILSLLLSGIAFAQPTYLMIFENDEDLSRITYPPGTSYELRNEEGDLIFNETNYSGDFKISKPHTLTIYPNWKDDPDVYELTQGKLVIAKTEKFFDDHKSEDKKTKSVYQSYGVTLDEKFLSDSETLEGQKNVRLIFSDEVVFDYIDGEARAYQNGKKLNIVGKYLVYSDNGVHKISFNSRTGTTYWVFDPEY